LDMARGGATSVTDLLRTIISSVTNLEEWTDVKPLEPKANNVRQKLSNLEKIAQMLTDEKDREEPREDLEALAEQELRRCADIIQEAARQLLAIKAAPRPKLPEGQVDLSGPIVDAASAIAEAAARLVIHATEAQRERVAKGRLPSGEPYKRDPAWIEGLISAAKYVALATQHLVKVANDCVQGKMDEASLIAAAKEVSAATAQLVAATIVKADEFSPTTAKLQAAAQAVREATKLLVDAAAQAVARQRPSMPDMGPISSTAYKIKTMEQVTKIIRLEKMLEQENDILKRIREDEYKAQPTMAGTKSHEKQLSSGL